FSTSQQLQVFGAKAKRCVLEIWAHLAWWISAVPGWDVGLPEEVVERILGWNLLSRPKRGFLVSLTRDWKEINFSRLISVGVPLYYVWGIFEDADPRFLPLSPRLISGYQHACTEARVRSLWGDEIPGLKADFYKCMRYDSFLQEMPERKDHPSGDAPRWTEQSGCINYEVKDFDSWKRRTLADDEDWHTLDKLYHHVVVEDRAKQVTTVVFLRFHRKPLRATLTELGDFMDEDVAEPDASEFRERFKGRCAPREGQIFDKETGVERVKPLDKEDEVAVQRFKHEQHFVPVSSKGPEASLRGIGLDANPHPDTTRMGRSLGPRSTGPSSDHSSERRLHRRNGAQDIYASERRRVSSPLITPSTGRAQFLGDLRDWAGQITAPFVLWKIPPQFGWNMTFLKEGYLIISEGSEVRLRLLALMTPGVRFARHVLELGIERGIAFQIALKNSTYLEFAPSVPLQHRATTKAQIESRDRRLEIGSSDVVTHERYLRLLGEVAGLPNARALIGRGGVLSWVVRAHGYLGLVQDFMQGPSIHVTVYHGGANDAASDEPIGVRWDDMEDSNYLAVYGYVPGPTRELDRWMYPSDELLKSLSKHYHREWNSVLDGHFRQIKKEWEDRPCRGKLRTRREWIAFFHPTNHIRKHVFAW
ncbi:hypothetical protein C8R46DRAFT_915703, partial [Mycena filopes]